MPDAGFVAFLAKGRIYGRAEPAELRQAIRARLSRDAGLGQNSARSASAEGSDRKDFREVCRGVSTPDRKRHRGRIARARKHTVVSSGVETSSYFDCSRNSRLFNT